MKNLLKFLSLTTFTIFVLAFFANINHINAFIFKQNAGEDKIITEFNDTYLQGVWVSTVYNLDFPSKQNLNETQLKNEIISILDTSKSKNITDVFFQVRPSADAFYNSTIFPPSIYLTGSQDKQAPFDVLQYFIDEGHARGLKIHAWVNPYRVTKKSTDILSATNPAKKNPELTILHTDGNLYFDPALKEVQQLIIDGVLEIVNNYDVDGIHFDDYFYPSTSFNDAKSYQKYGNGKSLDDFRRQNVTDLIKGTYDAIKKADSSVSFGVSPFGIWANAKDMIGGSNTTGSQSYFKQYADTKKWVEEEIIDYIAPQIYWNQGFSIADYNVLCDWWNNLTKANNVKLYIGHANYKEADGTFTKGEILRQVAYNKTKDNVSGSIFFRYQHIK